MRVKSANLGVSIILSVAAIAVAGGADPAAASAQVGASQGVDGRSITPAAAPSSCPSGNLCLYDGQNYSGKVLRLYYCGYAALENYVYSSGHDWRDKARSIYNNQTGGVTSRFYNSGSGGVRNLVGSLGSPAGLPTLSSAMDLKIDYVFVC